ncbi:MAG: xanthine dehydrogenase accessory protein XdhC [Sandaracinus sp.]|mgnify:CR=1 FL=1|nr:xanthine dehydrogenase accessory protein XdhC [Sandaracinus sp.]
MIEVTQALLALLRSGGRGALATVVRTSGSAPQSVGARMLLQPDGVLVGTVGGGAIEQTIVEALHQCQRGGRPEVVVRDLGRDLGMCCGGRMEVLVEPIEAEPRLILCGAGHVARPTAAFAREAGFRVTVVDDREELLTAERFGGCELVRMEPAEAAETLELTERDWVFIVTHDHHLDEDALAAFASRPHRYVGMIGSRRKVFRVLQRLQHRGRLPDLSRVYAPVGLDLGAVSPAEIGISVVAELVALRHGRAGAHLRAVDDPRLRKVLEGQLTPEDAARLPGD